MFKKSLIAIGLGLLVVVASAASLAELPSTIHYRGFLTTKSNDAPADGNFNVTFSLFPAATGGTASWTESQSVSITNGIFSVELGSGTPFPADLFANQLYLDISVAGESMNSRLKLTSVPYAFVAGQGAAAGATSCDPGTELPNFMDDDGDGEIDECYNRVFVTSMGYDGNLGGLAGADAKCQAAADANGSLLVSGSTYKALISIEGNTILQRLTADEKSPNPYYRTDNVLVANNFDDFYDGNGIQNPINRDEFGTEVISELVHTGTTASGTIPSFGTCQGFTSNFGDVYAGTTFVTGAPWTSSSGLPDSCFGTYRLYCMEIKPAGGLQASAGGGNTEPVLITGVTATANSEFSVRVASNTVSGAGLSNGVHTNDFNHMWLVFLSTEPAPVITFDLGSVQSITKMRVWNYFETASSNRGVNQVTLQTSQSAGGEDFVSIGTVTFPLESDGGGSEIDLSSISNFSGRRIRFSNISNHGSGTFTGLSEVQFFAAP